MTGDAGLAYLGPLAAVAGLDAPGRPRRGAAVVRRLAAGRRPLSRARTAGHESSGTWGADGPPGRAADGARLVGRAVTAFRAAAPVRLDFAGGWTDVPPFSAREGGVVVSAAIGLRAHAEVRPGGVRTSTRRRGPGRDARAPRRGRARRDRPALAAAGGAAHAAGRRVRAQHPVRRPARLGLGSSGALDVALVGALAAARGEARRRGRGRRPRLPARGRRGRDPRRPAGPVHRRVRRLPATRLPRPRGDRRAARARPGTARRARAPHDPGLHRRVPLLGRDDRPGDAGVRARATPRSPARCTGSATSPSAWPEALRAGDLARDRSRCSTPTGGTSRPSTPPCARRRWPGSSTRCARPARSAARRPARVPAARCSSSARTIRPRAIAAVRALGMTILPVRWAPAGRRGVLSAADLDARRELLAESADLAALARAPRRAGRRR